MNPTPLLPIADGALPGFVEPTPAMGFGELIALFILGNGQTTAGDTGLPAGDGAEETPEAIPPDAPRPGHRGPNGEAVDTAALLALLPAQSAPAARSGAPSIAASDLAGDEGGVLETQASDSAAATLAALGAVEGGVRTGHTAATTIPTAVTETAGAAEVPAPEAAETAGGPVESAGLALESENEQPVTAGTAVVPPSHDPGQAVAPTDGRSVEPAAGPAARISDGRISDGRISDGRDVEPSREAASPAEPASERATVSGPGDTRPSGPQTRPARTETGEPGPVIAGREAPPTTDAPGRTGPDSDGPATISPAHHRPAVEGPGGPVAGMRLDPPPLRTIEVPASLVVRVEQAIQMIEHAPPPRRITIDADELNGMRLTVAIRPDGVAVTSPTADAATMDAIEQALRARGFDLSDSGRRRDQRLDAYERDAWRPQPGSGAAPRPRTDQGIRL